MGALLKNNAVSKLSTSIGTGATTLSVMAGQGALFPSPSGSDWFPVTVIKATGVLEVMRCTARSGDVLTVLRAQEGTAAQPFVAGDRVELRLTTAVIDDILSQIASLGAAALLDANNLADLASVPDARSNLGLDTGATAKVATSTTDATVGRLLRIGDHGLTGPSITGLDANDPRTPGVYGFGTDSSHAPIPTMNMLSTDWGQAPNWQSQLAMGVNVNEFYGRSLLKDKSVILPWVRFYHDQNLDLNAVKTALGYKPVAQGTGGGQVTTSDIKIGWDGSASLRATVDLTDLGRLWTETLFKRPDTGFVVVTPNMSLPSGGSWAYSYTTFNGSGAAIGGAAGVLPGGSNLPGNNIGFAWRFV